MNDNDPRAIIAREPMHFWQIVAVAIATALNALDGFDVLSISFAAPGIAKDWGIDRAALGLVLSMELIGMGIGALYLGSLADRYGRRPAVLVCLVIMASGMFLASTADSVTLLSAYRLYTGLGIGGMLAATNAIVAECSNARRRNLCVAIMVAGYPIGAILGGSFAAYLLQTTGSWQIIFEFGALLTAIFIPIVYFMVPETIAFLLHKRPEGALAKINRTMVRQGRAPLTEMPPRTEVEKPAGFSLSQYFGPNIGRVTTLLVLACFGHMMTFYFMVKWIPKIVVDLGFPPAEASTVLVWSNIGGALGSVVLSGLSQKVNMRILLIFMMVCGAVAVTLFGQNLSTIKALSIMACIGGFFTNGAMAALYAVSAQSFPAALRAGGTGLVIGVGRAGAALGPIVAGILFSSGISLPYVATIMACGTLLGAVAITFLRYREDAVA